MALVAAITLFTGILFLLLALFRMGWISQFLSKAVITGFLSQIFRVFDTALLAYSTYYVHLILVFFLLAYLPYTKFAHIFFRTAAMIFSRWSGRDIPAPVTVL